MTASGPRAAVTIDWEDFGQLYCYYHHGTIPEPLEDIDRQTGLILDLLDEAGVSATFFVLGMLARHRPDLVKKIHASGHEIAVHGTNHVHLTEMEREAAKKDIEESIELVSDLTGEAVRGYRAPFFSITDRNLYMLDVLAELGIEYDSSIFPKAMPRYGIAGFDPDPRLYQLPEGGSLVELPLTVYRWAGTDWPVAGGGYVRLLPRFVLGTIASRVKGLDRDFVVYMHPYELDTRKIDIGSNFPEGAGRVTLKRMLLNFKWNLFRPSFAGKLKHMISRLEAATCKEIADRVKATQRPVLLESAL